jgi:phosphoribosyl-ATP pyrophosphohydrolase/phosphoribosyl-AMP cyclohydrolase
MPNLKPEPSSGPPGEPPSTQLKWDERNLLPAIVQDAASGEVLTLAYMNPESLRLTLETGQTWFWSRSRGELWHKGATSGNTQRVIEIRYDCDGDALLVRVIPTGPACHTGERSCFYRVLPTVG